MPATPDQIQLIVDAAHWDPFQLLGPHAENGGVAIRAFIPEARAARVAVSDRERVPMRRIHAAGLFEAHIPGGSETVPYRLEVTDAAGGIREVLDPYAFPPLLTDYDLHLFAEGTHYQTYEKLGAHLREVNGIRGVHFA